MPNLIQLSAKIAWNKGRLVSQKHTLKLEEVWVILFRLDVKRKARDLALFNLAIDSKLRACDIVKPKFSDVSHTTLISAM